MKSYIESIFVSSRIRLARNGAELPYPPHDELTQELMRFMSDITAALRKTSRFRAMTMENLSATEKRSLIEKHVISPLLAANNVSGAVLISADERVSVMLNEEDHIRLQCITSGLDLISAFAVLNELDNRLISAVPIAYDDKLGFLTACPTNLGTGMRASLMMFLPALSKTEGIKKIVDELNKVQIEVRGIYGEGTKANAFMYQISNKLSLGYSECNIINAVMRAGLSLAQAESKARETLIETDFAGIKDKSMRAYGTLNYAYKLSMKELYACYADIKLGEYYDFFSINNPEKFDDILSLCGTATLSLNGKAELGDEILRARQAKKILNQVCKVN